MYYDSLLLIYISQPVFISAKWQKSAVFNVNPKKAI